MSLKASTATAAIVLGLAGSASAAADLTVNYGSTTAPYTAVGLFQIVEPGNPFSDTPRTVVDDLGGTITGNGSAAPITTSNFTIDLVFTTLDRSQFAAQFSSALPDASAGLALYNASNLVASGVTEAGAIDIFPIDIASGTYTVVLSGSVYTLEAEGIFQFEGAPSSVPEPATWGMILIGTAGLGAILRGSRRKSVAV